MAGFANEHFPNVDAQSEQKRLSRPLAAFRRLDPILQAYADTSAGGAFVVVDGHGPEWAGGFSLAHRQSWPELWRVCIGRTTG